MNLNCGFRDYFIVLSAGGYANNGSNAGLLAFNANNVPSNANEYNGVRLPFFKDIKLTISRYRKSSCSNHFY